MRVQTGRSDEVNIYMSLKTKFFLKKNSPVLFGIGRGTTKRKSECELAGFYAPVRRNFSSR